MKIDGFYGPVVHGAPYDANGDHTRPAVQVDASHTTWQNFDVSNRRCPQDETTRNEVIENA